MQQNVLLKPTVSKNNCSLDATVLITIYGILLALPVGSVDLRTVYTWKTIVYRTVLYQGNWTRRPPGQIYGRSRALGIVCVTSSYLLTTNSYRALLLLFVVVVPVALCVLLHTVFTMCRNLEYPFCNFYFRYLCDWIYRVLWSSCQVFFPWAWYF